MASLNEEGAIGKVISDIKKYAADYELEVLIVDSSTDKTPQIARKLGAKVISQKPQGHGKALLTALKQSSGDIVITTDCDNTYPMEDIPKFVRLITEENYDIISANRIHRKNKAMPFANKMANRLFALLVRIFYRIPTNDVATGMFAMRREVIDSINWETNYSLPAEIVIKSNLAGFKWRQVNIDYSQRIGEITLHRWRSGKAYLRCIFRYRFKNTEGRILKRKI